MSTQTQTINNFKFSTDFFRRGLEFYGNRNMYSQNINGIDKIINAVNQARKQNPQTTKYDNLTDDEVRFLDN